MLILSTVTVDLVQLHVCFTYSVCVFLHRFCITGADAFRFVDMCMDMTVGSNDCSTSQQPFLHHLAVEHSRGGSPLFYGNRQGGHGAEKLNGVLQKERAQVSRAVPLV